MNMMNLQVFFLKPGKNIEGFFGTPLKNESPIIRKSQLP